MLNPKITRSAPAQSERSSQVDYRMARNAVIRNVNNGRLSRLDVCDAHPELMRAARHVGEPTGEACPICEEVKVVLVSYVFGVGLASGGHCVTSKRDISKLARRSGELTCYVVEVCPACSWNHLVRSFGLVGKGHP